eukprot:TRINITY_DN8991_c0_g1_i7.p1 TRINITY_DN8991_c0_g1~~TRINITY_DN8991_c0_g1_i7.p1  ORF type:complete len:176 (+),score=13.19 TRINITY_DN8991_c0_g1_i7:779-1306(+)
MTISTTPVALAMVITFDTQLRVLRVIGTETAVANQSNTALQDLAYSNLSETVEFTATSKPLVIDPKLGLRDMSVMMWIKPSSAGSGHQTLIRFKDASTSNQVAFFSLNITSSTFIVNYGTDMFTIACSTHLIADTWMKFKLNFHVHLFNVMSFDLPPCGTPKKGGGYYYTSTLQV